MGATKNRVIRNMHAKNYIDAVFTERLLEEGFTSPDNKALCWYRVMNNEIINSICFFSCWSNVPVMLEIGYGIYPLFTKPIYTSDVNFASRPINYEIFVEQTIREKTKMTMAPYSMDALVYAPCEGGRGVYTFDEVILPIMNQVHSIEECYCVHKRKYIQINNMYPNLPKYKSISPEFIDEVIYVNDEELYPYCKDRVIVLIDSYKEQCMRYPNNAQLCNELHHLEQLNIALFDNGHKEYLQILEQRKSKNIRYLEKKFGIICDN